MSKTNTKKPIHSLTGLRFIAAISVVLAHYGVFVLDFPYKVAILAEQSRACVSLFFILSGFILFYNYHDWFQTGVKAKQFWQFTQARFARVYPMHVVALLINTPIVLYALSIKPAQAKQYGDWFTAPFIGSWFANLFLVQIYLPVESLGNLWNPPAWSIASELVFYLFFPFFVAYVFNRFHNTTSLLFFALRLFVIETVAFLAMILVISLWTSKANFADFVDLIPYRIPFFRIWEFFIGCVLGAVFVRDLQQVESHLLVRQLRDTKWRNLVLAFTLICLLILAASSIQNPDVPLANLRRVLHWYVPYTPLLALMIITLAFGKTFVSPVLEHPWMLLLGEASYSLYITHFATVIALNQAKAQGAEIGIVWVVMSIMLCILASIGFLKLVEMPARRAIRGRR